MRYAEGMRSAHVKFIACSRRPEDLSDYVFN